ncbi:MAG: 5-formyltetrahydrofolate cyclo-ligase [Candidatus Omnitrophota bacterium]
MLSIEQEKQRIRKEISEKLKSQGDKQRIEKSRQIGKGLFRWDVFNQAETLMFYVSVDSEVDTFDMIRKAILSGKKVAVPTIDEKDKNMTVSRILDLDKDMNIGPYGIRQPCRERLMPISPDELDLIVVPGIAFDRQNNRLGRGKGYYDRLLANKSGKTYTVGLAFDFQVLSYLPHTNHDQPVDHLISA